MIDAVIFDVDGVLVDSYAAHFESWKLRARRPASPSTSASSQRASRRSREVIRKHWGASLPEEEVTRLDRRKEDLFREIVSANFPAMDGARELIESLAKWRIAVGSSAPKENVALVLDRLGVKDRIDAIVTGEDVTRGKPDPQVFRLAAERLGVAAERCVVIEDAVPGIEAARAAGMKVVALVSTGRDASTLRAAGPSLVVHSLRKVARPPMRPVDGRVQARTRRNLARSRSSSARDHARAGRGAGNQQRAESPVRNLEGTGPHEASPRRPALAPGISPWRFLLRGNTPLHGENW